MIRLLCVVLLATPLGVAAQEAPLRIEGTGEPVRVAAARHLGHLAYPASALEPLGARWHSEPAGARAVLFEDTLRFELLSPFFTANGRTFQLVGPVYRAGGALYLPHQFFTEWLPARYPARLRFEDGVLRLVQAAAAAPRPSRDSTAPGPAARAAPGPGERPAPPRPASRPTRIVIIDPGHGGRDPGKIGPNGLREKDVTLAVARRLAALLRNREGYEVHLTRTADTLISLDDRPALANRWKAGRPAALYISIHANSAGRGARGFETFFLSEARTEDERRVAEMENAAVAYEEERPHANGGHELDAILNTLRNDFYLRASNTFAEIVQRHLRAFHPGPDRGVKQAGFRVLVGAFMPAVLVEVAFISDAREARLLGSSDFQQKIAFALARAVDEFFAAHEHLWLTEPAP
jgi:N-acetylmuramoyl-L-alanine amidase